MNMPFLVSLVFITCATFFQLGTVNTQKFRDIRFPNVTERHAFYLNKNAGIAEFKGFRLVNCQIVATHNNKEKEDILKTVDEKNRKEETLEGFMNILSACDELDPTKLNEQIQNNNQDLLKSNPNHTPNELSIAAGTFWCGDGNRAESYYALGTFSKEDKCCRGHDLCPIYISKGTTDYGVKNTGNYTVSACECDNRFKECLRAIKSSKAKGLKKAFFKTLSMNCLDRQGSEPKIIEFGDYVPKDTSDEV